MKSVLICDSDPIVRSGLKSILKRLCFDTIYECDNGEEAVKKTLEMIPDLAIMDISLQKKDGIAAAAAIRQKLKIPIIFHTACSDHETLERAMKAGIAAFLSKPLREQDLWPAIELAFAHNHEIEQLKEQVEDLKETLESRKVIERAKGLLIASQGLSEPAAFRKMQKLAMDKRKSLRQIAEAILLTE
jgi:response regulator NasT